jgi:hypothetical protein
MQISGIAKIASSTEWAPAQPSSKLATTLSPSDATPASSAATAVAVTPVQKPASSAEVQNSPSLVQVTKLAGSYSATIAGKNYSESVEESGGVYIASVPAPPGTTASGGSAESAQHNLDIKLDALA